jgi:hypothetical protein
MTCHKLCHLCLEGSWAESPLLIEVAGQAVAGIARTNWGAGEVTITAPIVGLCRRWDSRGWAFALGCLHSPQSRYTLRGEITERGRQVAEQVLADLFLDWLAVTRHAGEVDEACRRTRLELIGLVENFADRVQPIQKQRAALRQAFKAGEQPQDYQRQMKDLKEERKGLDTERRQAELALRERFAAWMHARCERRLQLDETERLLLVAAVVVRVWMPGDVDANGNNAKS